MKEYEVHIKVRIKANKEEIDTCADAIVSDLVGGGFDFEVIGAEWDSIDTVSR